MGIGLTLTPAIRQALSEQQTIALNHLLQLKVLLQSPVQPDAVRGFEGMKGADSMLKERGGVGVLIGGVAETAWNMRRTREQLAGRKDVDVMVLSPDFELECDCEGGIDWWLPQSGRIEIRNEFESSSADLTWWENANETVLAFTVGLTKELKPGLYIPGPEWIADMRWVEACASVDRRVDLEIDWDVEENFKNKIRRYVHYRLPAFIRSSFSDQVLYGPYFGNWNIENALELDGLVLEQRVAINRAKNRINDDQPGSAFQS
jgi:hypothetical protein